MKNKPEFMDSWIYQPGFPLIQLYQINNSNEYLIKQNVFTTESKPLKKEILWKVPLFLEDSINATKNNTGGSGRQIIWLTKENETGILKKYLLIYRFYIIFLSYSPEESISSRQWISWLLPSLVLKL